jgi:UDP-2,3-diacylglucosamine pyrophosphatase LpxH
MKGGLEVLVFISDLHFADGSAGEHNVPTDAFKIFFGNISVTVNRLKKAGRPIEEIKLVFLGDIFDLLRTEEWLGWDERERPWGEDEGKIEAHANTIFDTIVAKNRETFDLFKGDLKDQFGLPCEPERIYIPGNHDRLCNKYDGLREKVCQNLRIAKGGTQPFPHYVEEVDYGVFALHGHEYDKLNFEGAISFRRDDYDRVPVGDPITTELATKLGYLMRKEINNLPLTPAQKEKLIKGFQEIDNVRPLSAVLEWILWQVKKELNLKEIIEDSVERIVKEFNGLKFVKSWYKHHDKWTDWWDEADKIQSILWLFENFKRFPSELFMTFLGKARKPLNLLPAASKEFSHLDPRIQYVIYGHSHVPQQIPVRVLETHRGRKEHVYLNTGTWRVRHQKTDEGLGFMSFKNLTYVAFYKKEERGTDFPAYETWTGTLKTV